MSFFNFAARRDYFFLKIFSFYLTFDIFETEKREEKLGIFTFPISQRAWRPLLAGLM